MASDVRRPNETFRFIVSPLCKQSFLDKLLPGSAISPPLYDGQNNAAHMSWRLENCCETFSMKPTTHMQSASCCIHRPLWNRLDFSRVIVIGSKTQTDGRKKATRKWEWIFFRGKFRSSSRWFRLRPPFRALENKKTIKKKLSRNRETGITRPACQHRVTEHVLVNIFPSTRGEFQMG